MKVLVIGADGQLGYEFMRLAPRLGYQVIGLEHRQVEIADRDNLRGVLRSYEWDVIVNTAAYHGERAYQDPRPERYYAVNVFGPYFLAEYAAEQGKVLVHFSTDYVFSGNELEAPKAFTESDCPRPASLYAASKYAGEAIIPTVLERHFIVRVASLYGERGCKAKNGDNFVEMVIRRLESGETLEVVDDVRMSPTSAPSAVEKVIQLLRTQEYGLYHVAGAGECSWYQFAIAIAQYLGYPAERVRRASTKTIKQDVKRGQNTALRNARLEEKGLGNLASWEENLAAYLEARKR